MGMLMTCSRDGCGKSAPMGMNAADLQKVSWPLGWIVVIHSAVNRVVTARNGQQNGTVTITQYNYCSGECLVSAWSRDPGVSLVP